LAQDVPPQLLIPIEGTDFLLRTEFGVGARALGMGGAFVAVGEDYTASYWNPAALAQIRRFEFLGSLGHISSTNNASMLSASSQMSTLDRGRNTRLDAIGFAYPVPTYRGSLVFAIGYNRVKRFDSNFKFSWFNNTVNDSVAQRWTEREDGGLNNWTFAGAVDVSPNLSLGAALNIWTGQSNYLFRFEEEDVLDIWTFSLFDTTFGIDTKYSGVNFRLGALYRLGRVLRFGASVATPTRFTASENWQEDGYLEFDEGDFEQTGDGGFFEYKIRSPWTFSAGGSIRLQNLLLSGQVDYVDWSQIRYRSEPPIVGLGIVDANLLIEETYRDVVRFRAGAELFIPGINASLRGGYLLDPSPFRAATAEQDREFLSLGFGILLDKQLRLDVGWIGGNFSRLGLPVTDGDDDFPIQENIESNRFFATFAFRF
jgi:hypothetical protein